MCPYCGGPLALVDQIGDLPIWTCGGDPETGRACTNQWWARRPPEVDLWTLQQRYVASLKKPGSGSKKAGRKRERPRRWEPSGRYLEV